MRACPMDFLKKDILKLGLFFREDLAPEQVSPDKLVPVPYA
jgi:hypothetical protein